MSEVQTLFWRLIAAPEGAEKGARTLQREGALATSDLSFLVAPDERMDPVERLDVYADMYFYRLRDCLAEDFPKLEARLGPARWHNLVTDYLLAHPPTHFSLREAGRALPDFVDSHDLARDDTLLADLARLEWARVDVFDETDAQPLSRDELLERGSAEPETAQFALVPSARLLSLDPAALPLWKRLEEGAAPEDADLVAPAREICTVLVWRQAFAVLHRSLPPDEAQCLSALVRGGTTAEGIGEVLAQASSPDAAEEDVAARLASLLEVWSRDELLIECVR